MRSRRKDILRRIVLVAIGIIVGSNVYMLNANTVGQNQMPMPFGIGAAVVQSGSMEPAFYTGDLLFVSASKDYGVGDVVVYQQQNVLVVHRVIDISGDGDTVTTKGDANNVADAPFSSSLIKGCVIGRVPAFGYVIDFLKSPIGILVLIGSAIALVELSFRRSVRDGNASGQTGNERYKQDLQDEIDRLKIELGKDDGCEGAGCVDVCDDGGSDACKDGCKDDTDFGASANDAGAITVNDTISDSYTVSVYKGDHTIDRIDDRII